MSKSHKSLYWLAFAGSFALFSCGNESANSPEDVEQVEVVDEIVQDSDESDDPEFIIPSALQISTIFKSSGLTYREGLTNSPDKTSDYYSKFEKLLNFGGYSADLFYCVLNDQSQLSIKYLKSIRQLADETGLSGIFNTAPIFERFEANIGNKDSVVNILLEFQEKTDVLIAENNEEHTAMIIFTGAWIEGIYIGLDAAVANENDALRERLMEQMTILPNLMSGLDYQPNKTAEMDDLKSKLKSIDDYLGSIEGFKGDDEYSYDMTVLTNDHYKELFRMVSAIRRDMVKSK
jgi:hypothetical protein